ncbi:MAG: flagellar biosynthesis anti-sigma factor FlgM [Deltaproteobacteria bacterium]|nr:flagellar biosynthesis anti-sigma factor FlgM [Deltaproteobacteria bacterium]
MRSSQQPRPFNAPSGPGCDDVDVDVESIWSRDGSALRSARIERIREALKMGTYLIDLGRIADRLLANRQP